MRAKRSAGLGDNRGQSLVEFVLLLPVLLILLAGLLDLGRLYFAYVAVTDAAAEGAAYAALFVPPDQSITCPPDDSRVCQAAREASAGLVRLEQAEIVVDCPSCPNPASGDAVTVRVVFPFTLVTPIVEAMVPGSVLDLTAVATQAIILGEPH